MCSDVDECNELGEDACVGGTCVNVIGSYRCECDEGTILDSTGRYCIGKWLMMFVCLEVYVMIFWCIRFQINFFFYGCN